MSSISYRYFQENQFQIIRCHSMKLYDMKHSMNLTLLMTLYCTRKLYHTVTKVEPPKTILEVMSDSKNNCKYNKKYCKILAAIITKFFFEL